MFSVRVFLIVNIFIDKIIGKLENFLVVFLIMLVFVVFFIYLDFVSRLIILKILRFGLFLVERFKCFFIGVLGVFFDVFLGRILVSKFLFDSFLLEFCFWEDSCFFFGWVFFFKEEFFFFVLVVLFRDKGFLFFRSFLLLLKLFKVKELEFLFWGIFFSFFFLFCIVLRGLIINFLKLDFGDLKLELLLGGFLDFELLLSLVAFKFFLLRFLYFLDSFVILSSVCLLFLRFKK